MQYLFLFLILGFLNNEDEETIKKVNGICERECFEEFCGYIEERYVPRKGSWFLYIMICGNGLRFPFISLRICVNCARRDVRWN